MLMRKKICEKNQLLSYFPSLTTARKCSTQPVGNIQSQLASSGDPQFRMVYRFPYISYIVHASSVGLSCIRQFLFWHWPLVIPIINTEENPADFNVKVRFYGKKQSPLYITVKHGWMLEKDLFHRVVGEFIWLKIHTSSSKYTQRIGKMYFPLFCFLYINSHCCCWCCVTWLGRVRRVGYGKKTNIIIMM